MRPQPGTGLPHDEIVAALPGLLRYALTLTREAETAADLVQDVVVKGIERGAGFRGESSVATWLHRIMFHTFIDGTRRRQPEIVEDEVLAVAVEQAWAEDDYTVDASAVAERTELREELYDALVRLPVIYRSAVVLHDMEGRPASEVAEICGVGLPAAKQRIRRGRTMLVTALDGGLERRAALKGVPMKCWEARGQIDDYLAQELAPPRRVLLEQHLETCPTCPALVASIVGVTQALGELRDPDSVVPGALAARINAALGRNA